MIPPSKFSMGGIISQEPPANIDKPSTIQHRRSASRKEGRLDPAWMPPSKFSMGGIISQDISLPGEYLMSSVIGDRVKPINLRQEHTDLLFFLFYGFPSDALQLIA